MEDMNANNTNEPQIQKEDSFKSNFGAVMANIGFTVGLGALWGTPLYIARTGGGASILVLILLCIFIAIPLCTAEMSFGRTSQKTIFVAMREIAGEKSKFNALGWLGLAANFLLTSTFLILGGVTFAYFIKSLKGSLSGISVEEHTTIYANLLGNSPYMILLSAIVALTFIFVIAQGVQNGLEKVCKILIPGLFIVLILLAIRNITLPGGMEGLIWFFKPDLSKITLDMLGEAMWTVFLLAPIGYTCAWAFGSYMAPKKSDLPLTAGIIVLTDTIVGIIVGLSIFPAMFAAGIDPMALADMSFFGGIPLTFDTIPGGRFLVPVFFILAEVAIYTTGLGLSEGMVGTLKDFTGWSRLKTAIVVNGILLTEAIIIILMISGDVSIRGLDPISLVQYFVMLQLIPISGLMIIVFLIKKYKFDRLMQEANVGAAGYKIAKWWKPFYYVIIPFVVVYTFYFGIKLFWL